jgi:serine/threonine protein kinase
LQQAVSRYQVPGIARVYEAGMHNDIPWCAMEYVPGPTLRMWMLEKLQFDTRVPPGLDLIQALVRIFDRVHELGCYGALKPENVVITPNGPVILDFGVPGFLTPQEFEFNAYARRYLPYMAPELRQDFANLVPQSDYYSVGALLYEILTGRPPASLVKLPSELSPVFGIEADEVVLKSLASNPNDRFGSNIGFYGALNALRDALRRQRPSSFAATPPDMLAADMGSAAAVHAPNLVSDPEQDFEPHLGDQNAATFVMDKPFQGMDPKTPTISMPAVQAGASSPNVQGLAGIKGGTQSQGFSMGNPEGDAMPALEELAESASAKAPFAGEDGPKAVASPWAALEARMTDEVVVGEGVAGAEPEASSAAPVKSFDEEWLAAPPTPIWVWLLIAFGGLLLTAAAGYFGYHYGH